MGLALLAAAGAAAYYVSVRTWLSAGPRGVQFTNDFDLVELFRAEPGAQYSHLTIGPDGEDIYAVRLQHVGSPGEPGGEELDLDKTGIVRIDGLQEEQAQTELLLKSGDLKDPALWDPGTDLSGTIFVDCCSLPEGKLSVANNGDLFFLATASSGTTFPEIVGNAPKGTSLIVRHADGALQKVLTVGELVGEGLLPAEAAGQRLENAVAASAPDRLWLLVHSPTVPIEAGASASIFRGFYQVQDPNGDGDWSDRKVRPLSLPPFVGADARTHEEIPWFFWQLVAEPSLGGVDRSRSFLLQMRKLAGEHRVYRVADHDGDGDALDGGEFELVFAGSPAHADLGWVVAPRTVVRDGDVVLRELVIHSYTTATRVSRVTESGEVIDIARAFTLIFSVLADSQGNIYVWGAPPDDFQMTVLYKLKPIPEGERPASQQEATQPAASPEPTAGDIASGVPQIAFTREVDEPSRREVLLVGVDGSGPTRLLENEHVWGLSRSPGGSRILYWSDEEIPNEFFTYVANADGSDPRQIAERQIELVCWLSEDSVIKYYTEPGYTDYTTLLLHDLESGQETTVLQDVGNVASPPCSPERPQLAFVSGLDFSQQPHPAGDESLELFDLETASRRLLEAPLADRSYLDIRWSPDGRRLGYLIGPPWYKPRPALSRYDLYVSELDGGARQVYQFEGGQYDFAYFNWSPSGDWLLVQISRGGELSPDEQRIRGADISQAWDLVLVNVESVQARQIVSGQERLYAAGWTPNRAEDSFTYVANGVLYLETADGAVRELARAAGDDCPFCLGSSFGWSPDGRYLGLWNIGGPGDPNTIAVLDVTTGEIETLVQVQEEGVSIWNPQWWR